MIVKFMHKVRITGCVYGLVHIQAVVTVSVHEMRREGPQCPHSAWHVMSTDRDKCAVHGHNTCTSQLSRGMSLWHVRWLHVIRG